MGQAAAITLADSVPTNRVYTPINVQGLTALFADTGTAATPAGQSTFSLTLKPATNNASRRVDLEFTLPVEYTDSNTGNVLVKDVFRFKNGSWVVPPLASALQIANFEALVRNLINHQVVKDYIKSGSPVW